MIVEVINHLFLMLIRIIKKFSEKSGSNSKIVASAQIIAHRFGNCEIIVAIAVIRGNTIDVKAVQAIDNRQGAEG